MSDPMIPPTAARASVGGPGPDRRGRPLCRRRKLTITTLAIALAVATTLHAQPASEFALRVPLVTERGDGLHALELPEAVVRASLSADLRDLRIFNARGEPLALAPLPPPPAPTPQPGAATELALVPLPAPAPVRDRVLADFALRVEKEGARAVIELSPAAVAPAPAGRDAVGGYLVDLRVPHAQHKDRTLRGRLTLAFAPDAPDHAGRIALLASDNLVDWQPLAGGVLVRSRQFGDLIERAEIDIPRVPPFIRVSWSGEAAPQLASARFALRDDAGPPPLPRATLAVARGEAVAGTVETWYVDLPVGLPVTRLHLRVPRDNQVVRVQVWRHDDAGRPRAHLGLRPRRAPERWVAEGGARTLYRVDRAGQWIENEPFAPSRRSTRLRIDVLDTPLGAPPAVAAEWRPARIAFAAGGPAPYTLAVGRADTGSGPLLDIARMLPAEDAAGVALPLARPAAGAVAPTTAASAAQRSARISREAGAERFLLWGVLAVAVALLAAMAWRIGRQLQRAGGTGPVDPARPGGNAQ